MEKWTKMWNSRRKSRSRNPMKASLTPWLCGQLALILLKTHIFITKVTSPHGQWNISSILVTISSTESCIRAIPQYLWHNIEKFKQQIIHLLWWIKQVDMCKGLGEKLFFTFLHQICFDRGFKWKVAKFHVTDRTNIFLYYFFIFRLFHA